MILYEKKCIYFGLLKIIIFFCKKTRQKSIGYLLKVKYRLEQCKYCHAGNLKQDWDSFNGNYYQTQKKYKDTLIKSEPNENTTLNRPDQPAQGNAV